MSDQQIPFSPFMPHLKFEDGTGRATYLPLSSCDEHQCGLMRQQMLDKHTIARRLGKGDICRQIEVLVRTVDERLELLEDIRANTPVKKVDPYEKMKISDG